MKFSHYTNMDTGCVIAKEKRKNMLTSMAVYGIIAVMSLTGAVIVVNLASLLHSW